MKTAIEIVPGKRYLIDATFNNGGVVEVVSVGILFCKVKDPDTGSEWETMQHRLSQIPLWLETILSPAVLSAAAPGEAYQSRINDFMQACFGAEVSKDTIERNHRFLEESLELVQANGCTKSEALQLVEYTFSRPIGEAEKEVGGVMVTLAALCLASGFDMNKCGEDELKRVWTIIDKIKAKWQSKPKHSPLPAPPIK